MVWSECPSGTYHEKVMCARKLQDTWSIPTNISRDSGDLRVPAVIVDSAGPLVVWGEEGHGWFRYARQIGDTWTLPKFTFPQGAAIPRLALDVQGRIHLLFDGSGGIWHSSYASEADSWTTPDQVAAGELSWQDIATDRRGHLHAVWMDYSTYGLGYSLYDGKHWSAPEALPDPAPGTYQSCDPKVAADVNCRPHVVWQERAGGYLLYYTEQGADTWSTPYRFFSESGGHQSILIDAEDRQHILWSWDYGVRYVTHTTDAWSRPVAVTSDVDAGGPELAMSASLLHVVWRQNWGVYYSEQYLPGFRPAVTSRCLTGPLRAFRTTSGYRLDFGIASADFASLVLANSAGRVVRSIRLGYFARGRYAYELTLDSVPSGVYFCTIRAGSDLSTAKVVVCR